MSEACMVFDRYRKQQVRLLVDIDGYKAVVDKSTHGVDRR